MCLKREREYAGVYEWYDLWYLNHLCGDGGASNSNRRVSKMSSFADHIIGYWVYMAIYVENAVQVIDLVN